MCISESWLSSVISNGELSILGYNLFRLDRNHHGGGISLYVGVSLDVQILANGPQGLEFLVLLVKQQNDNGNNRLCIGLFYRPPSDSNALSVLFDVLSSLRHTILTSIVLLGGFNVDFSNNKHPLY